MQRILYRQTGGKSRDRRTVHAQRIRDPSTRTIPVSAHLDNYSRTDPRFIVFPFFKLKTNNSSARLAKEYYFIRFLNLF